MYHCVSGKSFKTSKLTQRSPQATVINANAMLNSTKGSGFPVVKQEFNRFDATKEKKMKSREVRITSE